MKETWDSDGDPLAALRDGEAGPFEAFVVSAAPSFFAFFLRLGASPPEADDLVQDMFLKMFRSAQQYRPQGRFAAYAFRVARNAWIDRTRRDAARVDGVATGGVEEPRPEDQATSAGESPEARLGRREELARLRAALAELPEHHRLVFELGVVQELPYGEIAEILTIPVGTVKSRMFHAVRRLRELLGEDPS